MKKGCFLPAVITGTIIIAAAVYIVQNKFDDWFLKPGKNFLTTEIEKNWDNDLKYIHHSVQKDSLKALMKFYVDNVKVNVIAPPAIIEPDRIGKFILNDSQLSMLPDPAILKITTLGQGDEKSVGFYTKFYVGYWNFDESSTRYPHPEIPTT